MRADPPLPAQPRARAAPGALLLLALAACGGGGGEAAGDAEELRAPPATGDCATDPHSGALIGEILAREPTDGGPPGYRVRLETDPGQTRVVGTGVRVVPCAEARAERRETDPEPVLPGGAEPRR